MAGQMCAASVNEYPTAGGVLIVENIVEGQRKKTDIVLETIKSMDFANGVDFAQSVYEQTNGCGPHTKEAGL